MPFSQVGEEWLCNFGEQILHSSNMVLKYSICSFAEEPKICCLFLEESSQTCSTFTVQKNFIRIHLFFIICFLLPLPPFWTQETENKTNVPPSHTLYYHSPYDSCNQPTCSPKWRVSAPCSEPLWNAELHSSTKWGTGRDTVTKLHFTNCITCIFSAHTCLQRSLGGHWYERKQPRSFCLQSPNSRIETYAAYYSFFIFLTQKSVLKHIKSWHPLFTLSQTITLLSLCGSFNAK